MFLALKKSSRDFCSSLCACQNVAGNKKKKSGYLPVDVAKLVLTQSTLQANSDVEGSAGGNSTSNTRHCDNRDVLHLNVGRGLGNKHETLIQEV